MVNSILFRMARHVPVSILLAFFFSSCSSIRNTPKHEFADGFYTTKLGSQTFQKVYVSNQEEDVFIFPASKIGKELVVDTTSKQQLLLPQHFAGSLLQPHIFSRRSFDIDFLTIPFKYRPRERSFPRQFNTNLNGGLYAGFRKDHYVVKYKKNALGRFARQTTHFGISLGVFTGLGGTAMNPWVTNNQISIEYDGFVWTRGISSIIGLNKITVGLAVGWDHLMDRNKSLWIYQSKPWVGLAFGLNLN